LTGIPQSDDVLLYALAVCGPYQALANYKFKVKLLPGNMKKGKAAKTALSVFLHNPQATQQEKDLMRFLPDNDIIQTCLANVKVQTPGLFASKVNQKKKKKKESDE